MKTKLKITSECAPTRWLHVDFFKIGGCKPRCYVDQWHLTEDKDEATWIPAVFVKRLVADVRVEAAFEGLVKPKVECYAMINRKMQKVAIKVAALA